jgi:pyruvate formate lyase activating enzyme
MAEALGLCPVCARGGASLVAAREAHERARRRFGLPDEPPRASAGVPCGHCSAECVIAEGRRGYCGLRIVRDGRLEQLAGTPERGLAHWFRDPLPTRCFASWICQGGRQAGMHNLAVSYAGCTLDCLFCQNWSFRDVDPVRSSGVSAAEVVAQGNARTYCVRLFGGDPAAQMPHAMAVGKELAAKGIAVCWETAGTAGPLWMDQAAVLSLESGGCIQFNLKARTEPLHVTLTGQGNRRVLDNLTRLAERFGERPEPPLLVVGTLLVPGYVEADEVSRIAAFVAGINPRIPFTLRPFRPSFLMNDLPPTSVEHAQRAEEAAREAGLELVHVADRHLLGETYPGNIANSA